MISIIICTHNRCELLSGALFSLCSQTLNKSFYEIIIVDNASTDYTKDVVNKFINNFKYHKIKYIYEPKQGLSNARNAGYKKSSSKYVAYIDDDAKADENWLEEIYHVICTIEPDIFGGQIYPFYEKEKPKWFLDKYEIRTNGNEARLLNEIEFISGSNIIFKKEILELLNGFDSNLGMNGKRLSYGEETRLIVEARRQIEGIKIYYDPKIIVYHLVPAKKMKIRYFIISDFIRGSCINDIWPVRITKKTKIKYLILYQQEMKFIIWSIIKDIIFRKKKFKYYQNYILEEICPRIFNLGKYYRIIIS